MSQSHVGLLQLFQQFVELQESTHVLAGVVPPQTNGLCACRLRTIATKVAAARMANKMRRLCIRTGPAQQLITDVKGVVSTWRERLPNKWDDITVWTDLLSWRQHVFGAINHCTGDYVGQSGCEWPPQRGAHTGFCACPCPCGPTPRPISSLASASG